MDRSLTNATDESMTESDGVPGRGHSVEASVIVPSFDRPERLRECLKAVSAQEGVRFEVIVVDDGSPTAIAPICEVYGGLVRCVRQDNAGPGIARNRGVQEARAPFVAFTDDDCRPRPGWLSALVRTHAGRSGVMVGGHVENGLPEDRFASASQRLCDYLYDYFGASAGSMPFFTSNNIGLLREDFLAIGGFDASFGLAAAEDREFGIRWRDDGGGLEFAGNAVVDHFHAMSFRQYLRQHANYGRGARHLHDVMARRASLLPKVEPPRFYIGLVTYPMKQAGMRGLGQSVLLALSQAAMVGGYAQEARAARRRARPTSGA